MCLATRFMQSLDLPFCKRVCPLASTFLDSVTTSDSQLLETAGTRLECMFCGVSHLLFRMCLVEVAKSPKPVASCAMPIMPGMKVPMIEIRIVTHRPCVGVHEHCNGKESA